MTQRRRRFPGPSLIRILLLCGAVLCLALAAWPSGAPVVRAASAPSPVTLTLTGKVVRADLSGFEPDFDPIDRIVIAATLHDPRPRGQALPDTMVVFSTYLENFQPDTTPILPDLLHPNKTATGLGGFMTGKSVLVNSAGQTSYRGGVLAEVFLDNTAHMIVDVDRVGASASTPSLRLEATFTLYKDLSVRGQMYATRPLTAVETAALRPSAGGHMPSWQTVIQGMSVSRPPMMGTSGSSGQSSTKQKPGSNPQTSATAVAQAFHPAAAPASSTRQQSGLSPLSAVWAGLAVVALLVVVGLAALLWRRRAMAARRARHAGST